MVRHLSSKLTSTGSVTFVGGSAAYKASSGSSIVAAANAALDGLARILAVELAPIRVNVVAPGVFDGSAWDFLDAHDRRQTFQQIGSNLPIGRVGTSDEIAQSLEFLIVNSFATGTVLHIDGGLTA